MVTAIEAGPIEMIRGEKRNSDGITQYYDKVTICVMSDNTLSLRHYDNSGQVTSSKITPLGSNLDMDKTIDAVTGKVNELKALNYQEVDNFRPPGEAPSPQIGKRTTQQREAISSEFSKSSEEKKEEVKVKQPVSKIKAKRADKAAAKALAKSKP